MRRAYHPWTCQQRGTFGIGRTGRTSACQAGSHNSSAPCTCTGLYALNYAGRNPEKYKKYIHKSKITTIIYSTKTMKEHRRNILYTHVITLL